MLKWIVIGVYVLVPIIAWRRTREKPGATKTETRVNKCGNAFLAWGVIGILLASPAAWQLTLLYPDSAWIKHFLEMWLFWAAPLGLGLAVKAGQAMREKKKAEQAAASTSGPDAP
ncbi:MAG: hypothetical protein LBC55_00120 [Desulfovibrio sp.]|jgi:hypothetical protein|nr:hypothetical protein [Desulfovibrio sp.]